MKKYILLIVLIVQGLFVIASTSKDTTHQNNKTDNSQIIETIDSLLNNYYVKNVIKSQFKEDEFYYVKDTFIDFPDSIYVERIKRMNSPMDFSFNEEVKAFIDLYAKRRRNLVGVMLGLSDYYFPIFEQQLDKNNLPLELKYLPVIESALNPRAVSRAGATGLWQFMFSTGKMMGLKQTSYIDERRDPVRSTTAACKYLGQLYKIYGDWMLAIAAYNCGPGNVNKAIKRTNGKLNYWDVYYYLPKETRGYIPAFIAANYVMTYYKEHNIVPQKIELFATDTMHVNDLLHLEQVALVLNVDINLLRDLNPHFKKDVIPAAVSDAYALTIPAENVNKYIEYKDSIFAFRDSVYFNPKKIYYKPGDANSNDYSLLTKVFYTVKSGDKLSLIARWFNVEQSELKQWNKKIKKGVRSGQQIAIYVPKDKVDEYKKLNAMNFTQKQQFAVTNSYTNKQSAFKPKDENNTAKKTPVISKEEKEKKEAKEKEIAELSKVLNSIDNPESADSTEIATADSLANKSNKLTSSDNIAEVKENDTQRDYFFYTVQSGDTIWSIAKSFSQVTRDLMQYNNLTEADVISPGQKIEIKKTDK
ncbi:MAG: hypothetical protein A2491_18475 [Bacteroidetes bacterium RIFOXYC12_FULL_35_7]|nr:MAG: hypothetical protein A2491_18475 [Bacteroidetes bacterium RIFOXYC12_FULL_35_7]